MTDNEFSIVDELYFLIHFNELKEGTGLNDVELMDNLVVMIEKGWIALFENDNSVEMKYDNEKFMKNFTSYYYLATKKGLFEHNTN